MMGFVCFSFMICLCIVEDFDLNDSTQAAQLQKELDRLQELRHKQVYEHYQLPFYTYLILTSTLVSAVSVDTPFL